MNTFNRTMGLLLGLAAMVAGILMLAALFGLANPDSLRLGWWIETGLVSLDGLATPARWWALLAAVVVIMMGLLLAVAEVRLGRPERQLLLRRAPSGNVTVSHDTIRGLADHAASMVDGVVGASTTVRGAREALRVTCRIEVNREAIIPDAAAQVQERIREAVALQLGVGEVRVRVHAALARSSGLRRVS